MICVVTVVDSVSATSMPINEFIIFRSVHSYPIKQILLVGDNKNTSDVIIPEEVAVIFTGNDRKKIRNAVAEIEKENAKNSIKTVYHLHHQKSAFAFFSAVGFLGVKKKTLFTVHSTYSQRDLKYKLSSIFCALNAKKVNCVSFAALKEYSTFVKALKRKSVFAVPNGVDTERIDSAIDKTNKRDRNALVCVGRMIPLKNHEFLIKLMTLLTENKLLLIGAEDGGTMRALAEKLGVADRVEFAGLIGRDEVFSRISGCAIYLSASKTEGLPVSVLEAGYAGLLPVISDIAPHVEIAGKCKDICVLPLDLEIWAKNVRALSQSPDLFKKGERLSKDIKENFSLEKMHEKYFSVYEELAK